MHKKIKLLLIIFLLLQNLCYALNPEKEYRYSPEQFDLKYIETKIKTTDNYLLNCWLFNFQNKTNSETIIIANGDGGNMSYSLYYVKQLVELGYQVVTFDYRGFGKSSYFEINNDFLFYREFSYDLNAVVEYMKKQITKGSHLGLMAFSMGTIITTLSYPKIKENIEFIVSENFVLTPYLIKNRIQKLKKSVIIPNTISQRKYQQQLKEITTPLLIFASEQDNITTLTDSQIIKDHSKSFCNIIRYNGEHGYGLHALTRKKTGDIYFEKIHNFINFITMR